MRLVDIILSLPLILVALVLVVAVGQSFEMIIAVLALWIWPRFARMIREGAATQTPGLRGLGESGWGIYAPHPVHPPVFQGRSAL